MNKGLVLVAILVLTIFLTGCGTTTTVGKTFIGGNDGLRTTFLAGNPPDLTTDGGTSGFSIVVKAENVGESDIAASDGYVEIWGFDAKTFNWDGTDSSYTINEFKKRFSDQRGFGDNLRGALRGTDGSVLNGGVATIEFGNLKYLPTIQGETTQDFQANICYKYSTSVAAQICVKNNAEQALGSTDICTVEGEKNPQNSGAPIHVTSLKESYGGSGKIILTLTIEHVGSGDNFFKDDKLDCNDVESNGDRGKVKVTFEDIQVGGETVPVLCPSLDNGYIRLFKDSSGKESNTLYCTITVPESSRVVQVPVKAGLSYVYLQHIKKTITLRHISK